MPASFRLDGLDPYVPAEMFRECFQDRYLWISANTVVARRAAVREAGRAVAAGRTRMFLDRLRRLAPWLRW